ncbi:MAG: SoxR reducing system RseC family protein [Clostridia bacterium]|nr:SoxR reducing system RseC family protein [Clostridia bacterium]
MIEKGTVVETDGGIKVRIGKKTECEKCGMCAFPKNVSYIELAAESETEVKTGDVVTVETSENGKLTGVLLAFGVPLILIAACVLMGTLIFKNEIVSVASAIASLIVWETVLHFIDKKLLKNKRFISKIIAIEKQETKTNQGE